MGSLMVRESRFSRRSKMPSTTRGDNPTVRTQTTWRTISLLGLLIYATAVSAADPWVVFPGGDGPGRGKQIVLIAGDENTARRGHANARQAPLRAARIQVHGPVLDQSAGRDHRPGQSEEHPRAGESPDRRSDDHCDPIPRTARRANAACRPVRTLRQTDYWVANGDARLQVRG